jgi:hypothetical protein
MGNETKLVVEEGETRRFEVELSNGDGLVIQNHLFHDKTLARQKYAAVLRTLDCGSELALYDLEEGTTLLHYQA